MEFPESLANRTAPTALARDLTSGKESANRHFFGQPGRFMGRNSRDVALLSLRAMHPSLWYYTLSSCTEYWLHSRISAYGLCIDPSAQVFGAQRGHLAHIAVSGKALELNSVLYPTLQHPDPN